ncbi:hypothetical protein BDW75DRAFT_39482 [Aspergillus navahoensis]
MACFVPTALMQFCAQVSIYLCLRALPSMMRAILWSHNPRSLFFLFLVQYPFGSYTYSYFVFLSNSLFFFFFGKVAIKPSTYSNCTIFLYPPIFRRFLSSKILCFSMLVYYFGACQHPGSLFSHYLRLLDE